MNYEISQPWHSSRVLELDQTYDHDSGRKKQSALKTYGQYDLSDDLRYRQPTVVLCNSRLPKDQWKGSRLR